MTCIFTQFARERFGICRLPGSCMGECHLSPVHTYPFSFEKVFCLYGYSVRPHVSDENDQWKGNFSKTLSRVELFKNAVFACTWERRKRNSSKKLRSHYQFQSTPRNQLETYLRWRSGAFLRHTCPLDYVIVFKSINRISTGENDAKTKKKSSVFKRIRIRVDKALIELTQGF